ncbi:dihydropteroate synthase [Jezberella montanilacus]|uniref:dihydropteroate synthase n=1 Tax=Jezberella montanilacus TaxID=323426 RepID=A0A2T0XKP9_9BURK|nr:dihydropteroate synthase [Jezberella montanilacus]PRY99534.1 dihydropteroate synthase [Jezberella montanilacus]
MALKWVCGRFDFDLNKTGPLLMGIINVTPDSFSGDGMYAQADAAIAKGLALIADGARILDIGGESTRPGAQPVAADEEIARIMPVLEVFRDVDVALSVDTRHAAVMKAALDAGADIINDISGFRDPQAQNLVAAHPNCGVCIMHMQGDPSTMQIQPEYTDIVSEVKHYLVRQAQTLEALGIAKQRICIDPGFGFGKSLEQNFQLLAQLKNLTETEYAVLVGVSRKSMIGMTTQKSVKERVFGSVAAAVCGLERGASILRVHDVGPTLDAVSIWQAVQHGVISE